MKSLILLLISCLIVVSSCGGEKKQTDQTKSTEQNIEQEKAAIIKLMNENFKAYQDKNLDVIMATYANLPDVMSIGSEQNEFAKGYDQIKKVYDSDFKRPYKLNKFEFINPQVVIDGEIGWFVTECKIAFDVDNKKIDYPSRLCSITKKINGKWLLMQLLLQAFPEPLS